MTKITTAAALALLLVTAGLAGAVSAQPTSTDIRPTADVVTASSDAPAPDTRFERRLAHRLAGYDLTDAQVREIVTEARRLRADGASRLVIRSMIVMHLYEFGVDAPFLYAEEPADAHDALHRSIATLDLTAEQARVLHAMVHRMADAGATRAEIRRAVDRQLAAWDAEPPGIAHERLHRFIESLDLAPEQARALHAMIHRMADDGATPEEIRQAVRRQLAAWEGGPSPVDANARSEPGDRLAPGADRDGI